jgi:hypothetical protein
MRRYIDNVSDFPRSPLFVREFFGVCHDLILIRRSVAPTPMECVIRLLDESASYRPVWDDSAFNEDVAAAAAPGPYPFFIEPEKISI